jgi:glyoxylase-like metal-dependent hydrolase (beta-lactamase superfamily II)
MSEKAWDEPGVEHVMDGVFRIPLPLPNDGLRAVNVYVIVDGDGLVLVDAGWALDESLARLARGLADIGHELADIRQFLVTHVHRDHDTQALTVRRMFGSQVRIGAGERTALELLTSPDHQPFDTFVQRIELAGAAELIDELRAWKKAQADDHASNQWELPDNWLTPGTLRLRTRSLEVIETPGHTTGHVVFHDRAAGALFTGDHVLPRITPSIGLESGGSSLPLVSYMDSLRLVLGGPDARLLPAHGPVTDSVHARAEALLAHHEQRLAETAAAVEAGADTAYAAAKILRWMRHARRLGELDLFNRTLAIGETRAHLDVCVVRGWLRSSDDADGVRHYQRA